MKTFFITLALAMLSLPMVANTKMKDASNDSKSKPSVVVVGICEENITSNCFSVTEIAESMGIEEEQLKKEFVSAFSDVLVKSNFSISEHNDFSTKIDFQSTQNEVQSSVSNLSQDEYEQILIGAKFLLVIDQFNLRKEGYPYNNYSNIIRYSLYDSNKNRVCEGRHHFSSLDVADLDTFKKQLRKAASKITNKVK